MTLAFPAAVVAAGLGLILYGLRARPSATNGTELALIQNAAWTAPTVPARAALVMSADQSAVTGEQTEEMDEEAVAEMVCDESNCEEQEESLKQSQAKKTVDAKDLKAEKRTPGVSQMADTNSKRHRAYSNKMEQQTAQKLEREALEKKRSKVRQASVKGKESMLEEVLEDGEEEEAQFDAA